MKFTEQIKQALAKKQAAQHPDNPNDTKSKEKTSAAPVVVNKPAKRSAGRGR